MGQTKRIGIRVKNLYKLEVDGCAAMMGKVEELVSWDEGELWHRRLGNLHHGALKILQQISIGLQGYSFAVRSGQGMYYG